MGADRADLFHYSDTWQLIVNTSTTIVTFLIVFLIQNSQNRDAAAMQAKLDEIIRSLETALAIGFIGIEHLTEGKLQELRTALESECDDLDNGDPGRHEAVERLLSPPLSPACPTELRLPYTRPL